MRGVRAFCVARSQQHYLLFTEVFTILGATINESNLKNILLKYDGHTRVYDLNLAEIYHKEEVNNYWFWKIIDQFTSKLIKMYLEAKWICFKCNLNVYIYIYIYTIYWCEKLFFNFECKKSTNAHSMLFSIMTSKSSSIQCVCSKSHRFANFNKRWILS